MPATGRSIHASTSAPRASRAWCWRRTGDAGSTNGPLQVDGWRAPTRRARRGASWAPSPMTWPSSPTPPPGQHGAPPLRFEAGRAADHRPRVQRRAQRPRLRGRRDGGGGGGGRSRSTPRVAAVSSVTRAPGVLDHYLRDGGVAGGRRTAGVDRHAHRGAQARHGGAGVASWARIGNLTRGAPEGRRLGRRSPGPDPPLASAGQRLWTVALPPRVRLAGPDVAGARGHRLASCRGGGRRRPAPGWLEARRGEVIGSPPAPEDMIGSMASLRWAGSAAARPRVDLYGDRVHGAAAAASRMAPWPQARAWQRLRAQGRPKGPVRGLAVLPDPRRCPESAFVAPCARAGGGGHRGVRGARLGTCGAWRRVSLRRVGGGASCGWGAGDSSVNWLSSSWRKPLSRPRRADTVVAGRAPRRCDPISHRR